MSSSIDACLSQARAGQFSIWGCILLAACSAPLPGRNVALPTPVVTDSCRIQDGMLTPEEAGTLAALRRNVESGPLYTIPAAAGVSACSVGVKSGVITLEYQFKDGGRLHVKRDLRIEYTEQVARIRLAREKSPVAVLADAERVAFGASGVALIGKRPTRKLR